MRSVCDYVVTSGGIGPTHDDVTYEAVAKAFGVPLAYDATTLDKMAVYMAERNSELNEARKRMALFPQGCRTYFVESALWVPVVMMDNVHIYPGVPRLFERMITGSNALFEQGPPFVQYEVFTRQVEGDFAEGLTQVATAFPSVKIGSYPHVEKANKYTRLFIEGRDETLVKDIVDQLAALTAAYAVKHVPVDPPAQAKL